VAVVIGLMMLIALAFYMAIYRTIKKSRLSRKMILGRGRNVVVTPLLAVEMTPLVSLNQHAVTVSAPLGFDEDPRNPMIVLQKVGQ